MYKLANNVELIEEPLKDGSNEYVVTVYNNSYKDFIVNKIIFDFIQQFKEPNTIEAVIAEYLKLTNAKGGQVEIVTKQLSVFYNDIIKKGWIVSEENENAQIIRNTQFLKGDFIGEYKILKILSNNELTDVYLAKALNSRKRFVIKYLNPAKFKKESRYIRYKDYFFNEYKFLDSFKSAYINKAIEFIDSPESCFMVMQFINGKSVKRYVKENRLTTKEKSALVTKILRGFSVIHENSIYHGDIHLSNILITSKGQIKIIDFGYSNYADQLDATSNRKKRNGGVHAFIPPERALRSITRKFNAVNQYQSEVYQIGLIVYYLYVKELPFKSGTWKTMVDEKKAFNINCHQPFLKRRMPVAVRQIIAKSLENDPDLRYKTAKDMLVAWKKIS